MKKMNKAQLSCVKRVVVSLLCILVASKGIMNYLTTREADSDIVIEQAAEGENQISQGLSGEQNMPSEVSSGEQDQLSEKVSGEQDLSSEKSPGEQNMGAATQSGKININTADSEELQCLKGIGPTKSQNIIAYREEFGGFTSIEEINEVNGIGDATYSKIKDYIAIE